MIIVFSSSVEDIHSTSLLYRDELRFGWTRGQSFLFSVLQAELTVRFGPMSLYFYRLVTHVVFDVQVSIAH